jgi:hypothetical protein
MLSYFLVFFVVTGRCVDKVRIVLTGNYKKEFFSRDGNIKKYIRTIYNCKLCIAVDLISTAIQCLQMILKHNQKGTMLGRVTFTEINHVLLASRGYEYDGFLFS